MGTKEVRALFLSPYLGFDEYFFLEEKLMNQHIEIEDITERHNAKLTLEQSEQRFRSIFGSTTDAIVITDRDSRIIDVNRRATLLFGYGREELLRMGIGDIDPDFSMPRHREII